MNINIRTFTRSILFLLILIGISDKIIGSDACMLVPVDMQSKINNSSIIVEGKVISSNSYWNNAHNRIYTLSRVKVFKVFKGNILPQEIEIYTPGGRVGLDMMEYTSILSLAPDQEGIFCCMPLLSKQRERSDLVQAPVYDVYSSIQGFFEYNSSDKTASVPFQNYSDINLLYQEIISKTGQAFQTVIANPFFQSHNIPPKNGVQIINAVPTITNFTPSTITAGTRSLLTINGTNFGATRGNGFVEFKNANDGGGTLVRAKVSDYRVWTDTQIQLWVPSSSLGPGPSAGTGTVKVTNNDPSSVVSAGTLTITYSIINVEFNSTGQIIEQKNLNGLGGYTFHFEASAFATNAPAVAAFTRAFNSWICNTHINWRFGANTSNNTAANDGEFVIRFDVGSELPSGVLGSTSSSYSGCVNPTDTVWFPADIDVTYDGGAGGVGFTWQFGPAAPSSSQIDFESVNVHELGHTHGLQHIILSSAVMHYSISNGVLKRTLNASNDIAAGNFIMINSLTTHGCKGAAMTSFTPAASLSIAASLSTTICSGTNLTFTATPTQGGDAPVYQWKKNGTVVGANSTTYSDNGLNNADQITCTMTSSISCATNNPATSNTLIITITSTNDGNACTVDACNTTTGIATHTNTTNDGNACTTDVCNTATGVTHTPVNTDDGNACTTDACATSTGAIAHTPVATNDGNACTTDACNTLSGAITHTFVDTNDGNACTDDFCNSSSGAITHTPVNTSDGNACTTDACNTSSGTITHTNVNTDDGNACTTDGCITSTGVITHDAVPVNDGNACTTDACNTLTGAITHTFINTSDGNACTDDVCNTSSGAITHNVIPVSDGNACTTDACNTLTGVITHDPVSIDDNNACTTDVCDTLSGIISHDPVPVDDGNICTIDGCNPITGVYHNPATEICGNGIDDNCDGFIDENCGVSLNLRVIIQGFYNAGSGLMDNGGVGGDLYLIGTPGTSPSDVDTILISVMDPSPPYSQVEQQKTMLKINGDATVSFSAAVISGQSYYIKVDHRNTLATWSKVPVLFSNITTYDFTVSSSQAFDDGFNLPMKLVAPGKWALFNGDINGDGGVDSQDMTIEENNSNAGFYGYYTSDLNGDGGSDSLDMTIIEDNGNAGVFETHP